MNPAEGMKNGLQIAHNVRFRPDWCKDIPLKEV